MTQNNQKNKKIKIQKKFLRISIPLWLAENLSWYSILIIVGPRKLDVNFLKKKISKRRISIFSSKDDFFYLGLRIAKIFNKTTLRKMIEILLSIRFSLILESAFKEASGKNPKETKHLKDYDMHFFNIFFGKIKAIEEWKNNQI